MKIITNYKDYYDHVAFMYGGGDPKIVYVRPHRLKEVPYIKCNSKDEFLVNGVKYKCNFLHNVGRLHNHRSEWTKTRNGWEWVSDGVMGIVIGDIGFTKIKTPNDVDYRFVKDEDLKDSGVTKLYGRFSWDKMKVEELIYFKDPTLVNVCREIGTSVFSFSVSRVGFNVDELMPNLGKLGIPSFITANEMYQHLSYFIGNTINESPDMMKPVKIPDKIKIESHGFDYKTSFRKI